MVGYPPAASAENGQLGGSPPGPPESRVGEGSVRFGQTGEGKKNAGALEEAPTISKRGLQRGRQNKRDGRDGFHRTPRRSPGRRSERRVGSGQRRICVVAGKAAGTLENCRGSTLAAFPAILSLAVGGLRHRRY